MNPFNKKELILIKNVILSSLPVGFDLSFFCSVFIFDRAQYKNNAVMVGGARASTRANFIYRWNFLSQRSSGERERAVGWAIQ